MVCTVLCLMLLALAPSPARDADSVRRALEARYRHASTLKAVFFERYNDGSGGISAAAGTVYFSRPGRMRWEYESPETKLFLVDGKNVWFYVPVDRTASRATLRESSDWRTPLALLAGKANLARLCGSLELVGPSTDSAGATVAESGNRVLRCLPRGERTATSETYFREVLLEVDFEFRLVRVVIRQAGDIETDFRFGNWEENAIVPESKFHFEPPPGVAIVDEASLAGEIH
jgi:outer membrane lipoprotein carrier protein